MTRAANSLNELSPATLRWLILAALAGLGFSAASTWVHYQMLNDPLYAGSVCDVSTFLSCSQAYSSRFGSVAGVPVALIGMLYFAFVLGVIALCQQAPASRANLTSYVFVLSTLGLAVVLYLGYASFFVLNTLCLLCLGTYAAIIALFVVSGVAQKSPVANLPDRLSGDLGRVLSTPAALLSLLGFGAIAAASVLLFPTGDVSASTMSAEAPVTNAAATTAPQAPQPQITDAIRQELADFLAKQPRVTVPAGGGSGAAVVIVKFNDYLCPACGMTAREYKPVLAALQKAHPGKIVLVSKDYPLDPECNALPGLPNVHPPACEAAAAVRLAREKGKAEAMEEWLFGNQPTLTPEGVIAGAASVGGVTDFAARYQKTLELVRADVAHGLELKVQGTPTFFLNGIRLPNWPAPVFQAAVEWELARVAGK